MRRVATAVIVAGLALITAAAGAFTLDDQTGRTLALPGPPRRIVSLVPSATEVLFAIGAQDRLVGVTDFCDFPAEARLKPRVGGMISPSLEAIVALRPDVVVATPAGNREDTLAQLGRLRIPVFAVNAESLREVLDLVDRLGRLAGRPAQADALAEHLRARVREVRQRVASLPRPRVLYVLWPEPLIVPGRGALVTELIELAGGRSVTADAASGYPRYSTEAAVAHAPEVIVLARHGHQPMPVNADVWRRFTDLPAVRGRRLHTVDRDVFHRYGPRVVDGLEQLARMLHPDAFPKAAAR